MSRTVLLDGDVFIYQASAANEYECQWDAWLWTLHADLQAAIAQFNDTVDRIAEELGADRIIVALSDEVNWRKSVMPTYKHNRVAKRKPVIYKAMREYVAETRETFLRPTLEGDDVLGILSTHPHLVKGEKIIVSIDKDMKTVPGLLLNDSRARKQMTELGGNYGDYVTRVTEEDADKQHMMQTLTGDVTDGYPGCPGVGPVKAEKVLGITPAKECWPHIVAAYEKAGLSEEVALMNARVARIARSTDYDFQKKEIKLWTPLSVSGSVTTPNAAPHSEPA
jgi:DNA polymerase-1